MAEHARELLSCQVINPPEETFAHVLSQEADEAVEQ